MAFHLEFHWTECSKDFDKLRVLQIHRKLQTIHDFHQQPCWVPVLRPENDSTVLIVWHVGLSDGCLSAEYGGPMLSSSSQQAGRQREGVSISSASASDNRSYISSCHRAGDKTSLLFTDHTSTLDQLTPGNSRACWDDAVSRKMYLFVLISVHIHFLGIDLGIRLSSHFQFTWDVGTVCNPQYINILFKITILNFVWHQHPAKN